MNTVDNFRGGKIAQYTSNWQDLSSDMWILRTVTGYLQELCDLNVQGNSPHTLKLPHADQAALDQALHEYEQCHIIEPATAKVNSFYSTLFPIYKSDGSVRVIFNLKTFNSLYVEHVHFKMDTIKDVLVLVKKGCFFATIDFKHAYFSVPVAPHLRHYFKFQWKQQLFQFTCLPQGFSSAPRIFTKLLKPALSHLRSRGIQVLCYIDDCIFIGDNASDLRDNVLYAVELFDSLGLTLHPKKSQLVPTQQIEFLGFMLDSTTMQISLTAEKKDKIAELARRLLERTNITILDLASFIGNLVAADPAVPLGPLHYKFLEIERNELLTEHIGNYDTKISLSSRARQDIEWWSNNIHNLTKPIVLPFPDCEIFTDASMSGWGATMNSEKIDGNWAESEICHINQLELKAAFLAAQTFCRGISPAHIKIRSDNTTTVACINKAGSTKPDLHTLTVDFLTWASNRDIVVSAAHIPGVDNVDADAESRKTNHDAEWMLKPHLFARVCHDLAFRPTVDMFATRINAQLSCYVSWRPDPTAYDIDAFSFAWTNIKPYCFPPFSVIGQTLREIRQSRTQALVILPLWPTKPWFVQALQMLMAPPILLPYNSLQLPQNLQLTHPLARRLKLAALLLSGQPLQTRAYRQKLQIFSSIPGDRARETSIATISRDGCNFVVENRLVHFRQL